MVKVCIVLLCLTMISDILLLTVQDAHAPVSAAAFDNDSNGSGTPGAETEAWLQELDVDGVPVVPELLDKVCRNAWLHGRVYREIQVRLALLDMGLQCWFLPPALHIHIKMG